jgi:sodium/potassium-transporting ATPase subunit alpha
MLLNGKEVRLTPELKHSYEDAYKRLCNMGERVVGFCQLHLPENKYPKGFEFDTDDNINFPLRNFCFLGMVSLVPML